MNAAALSLLLLTLTITTTTTAVAAAAPAPGPAPAVLQADDDVAPTKWSIWPYKHVHISNELGPDKAMTVHCTSSNDDLGVQNVAPGDEFTWRFKQRFMFGHTKYRCVVSPAAALVRIRFLAFSQYDDKIPEHDNNVYWAVKPEGVYMRDPSGETEDLLNYVWMPGN